jgi:hypothetical protein
MRKLYFLFVFLLFGAALNAQSTANYAFSTGTNGSLALDMNANAIDMSTGTTQLVAASVDDGASAVTTLPFDFWLMGNKYTQFSVSSNGLMQLGSTVVGGGTYVASGGSIAIPRIAAFAAEGGTGATGKIHYKVVGTAPNRCLVIEFIMNLYYTTNLPTDGTYQIRLYETGGIEFTYGAMSITDNTGTFDGTAGIGFSTGTTANTFAYVTTSTNTATTTGTFTDNTIYPVGPITNLNSSSNGSRRFYRFIPPPPPAAPSALTFTSVGTSSMTLNWVDNASSEGGYYIYRSTDGVNFVLISQTAANATNSIQSGLSGSTLYYWQVVVFNESGISSALSGSQSTLACSSIPAGTYTVGPTGTYLTLTAATTALATGTSGSVTLELQPSYTDAGETFPITFSSLACPVVGTITVRPQAGASGLSITSANTTATIDLNTSKNLVIDGRPGGIGTTSQLAIINTAAAGVAIRFINDAQNTTITYCDVQGQNTSVTSSSTASSGVIYFGGTTTGALLGNDNNTISFSKIHGVGTSTPAIGISAAGTVTSVASYNDNNTVTGCTIYDFFSAGSASTGIKLDAGTNAWIISNNNFFQTAARVTTASNTHRAIWVTPNTGTIAATASGFIITGNFIGGSAAAAGGTAYTMTGSFANVFNAMDLSVGLGTATSVQNNTIKNIAISTTSGAGFIGISQANGNVNVGTVTGNTIGATTGTDNITVTTTLTGGGVLVGYRATGGTGAIVNFANNSFGSVTTIGSATLGHSIIGINVTGATTINVTNNTIGSTTTANSINASSPTTGNAQSITGISITLGTTTTVSGNIVANLNNNYTGTGTGQVRGIVLTTSASSITGNTIRNLSCSSQTAGTGSGGAVVGISMTSTNVAGVNVSGNVIHSLNLTSASTTAATGATGIFYSGATTNLSTIDKNFIHSFDVTAVNTNTTLTGIDFATATATISNNMIRLGVRPDGSSLTTEAVIRGISSNSSTTLNNVYHNTIYIGGTGVGTTARNSYAFIRTATSGTYDIRNNIFINNRSNAAAGGKHYAIFFTTANTGASIDYNIYSYSGTGGVFANNGTADVAAYASAWLASDVHSFSQDPLLANSTGTAAAVDLHLTAGSIAEGTGVNIPSVTDDIDNQVRSGLTPTDIGADAGNYGLLTPDVGAVTLVSPVSGGCGSATQPVTVRIRNYSANTINFATNNVTVNASATGPVAYSSSAIVSTGTLAPGATLDVTMPASINTSAAGTYVFTASTTLGADLNGGNNAMATQNIVVTAGTSLSGTYTVGAGGNYTTLTAAVAAYNAANCISGNVVFSLTDVLYNTTSGEIFPIRINSIANPSSYTLTIRPATGINATIDGSDSTIIKLNGADNIIIDGSNNGSTTRNLTISNTKATSQAAGVWIASFGANGAINNTVKNLIIIGGSGVTNNTTGLYGIVSSANSSMTTGNSDNDNLTITNNAISKTLIAISAIGTILSQDGLLISNNVIGSATASDYVNYRGIEYAYTNNAVISSNSIFNLKTLAANTNQPSGIDVGTGVIGGSIIKNNITGLLQPNTGGYRIQGISFSATGTSDVLVANNFISDVRSVNYFNPSTFNAFGMYFAGGTNLRIYNNTINMSGPVTTGTGAGFSSNIYITTAAVTGMDFRNNILVNTQDFTVTGASTYNIYVGTTGFNFGTINNNDYYGASSATTTYRVGYDGTTQRPALTDWRNFTGQDVNSINIQPQFNSATDLHIDIALGAALDNKGTPVAGVTTDIDGDVRNATTPDVGADEFSVVTGIDFGIKSLVSPVVKNCYGNAETVTVRLRNYSANTHNFALIPVTVNASVTGTNPITFSPVIVNTGTIAPGDSLDVVVSTAYNMTAIGTYTFNASSSVTADVNAANNAMPVTNRVLNTISAGVVSTISGPFCISGTPTLTLTGANGTIQWQQSNSATGPWTNVGTGATTYTPSSAISATTYYQVVATCNANSATSNVQQVLVNNPQLLTTTPGSRCGPGTVTLSATGSAGSVFNWYASASGGLPIATAPFFTTPVLNSTTTYYVTASSGGSSYSVGLPDNTGAYGTFGDPGGTGYGLYFTTSAALTITSVYVYPQAAGTSTIELQDGTGATIAGSTATVTFTAANVNQKTLVNLGFIIPAAGSYRLMNTAGVDLGRFNPYSGPAYPLTYGAVTLTQGSLGTGTYYNFFDWQVSTGCESARTAVIATVSAGPAFDVTNNTSLCNNAVLPLTVNSPAANFNSVTWSPTAGLFTDAAATTAYTGGNASTVYVKQATAGVYTYVATAVNSTTSCSGIDSVKVTVLPATLTIATSSPQICVSGTTTLSVSTPAGFGNATFQWLQSPTGTGYTNITGATNSTYTTPTISTAGFYQVIVKDGQGGTCLQPTVSISVNNPQVLTTTPATNCAASASVTLGATGSAGTTLNWYAVASGGTQVGSGTSFTTPTLTGPTTYYVAASSGNYTVGVGKPNTTGADGTASTTGAAGHLKFDALSAFTLNSVVIYPAGTGTGTVTIAYQDATGVTLTTSGPIHGNRICNTNTGDHTSWLCYWSGKSASPDIDWRYRRRYRFV